MLNHLDAYQYILLTNAVSHLIFGLDDKRLEQVIEICLAEEEPDTDYHQEFRQQLLTLLDRE